MEKQEETNPIEELIINYIAKKYNITPEDLEELKNKKAEGGIPINIIADKKLSNLEAITKYMRENQKKTYKEISQLLHRATSTLAVTYKKAKTKKPKPYTEETTEKIPYSAFNNKNSILESICLYLKGIGLKNSEIARKIGKNPRTIWTTLKRAENK